jgi:hypothetical protein
VEETLPAVASDEVAVRVSVSMLDPHSFAPGAEATSPEASFSGLVCDIGTAPPNELAIGGTVVGVGPVADVISLPGTEVERLAANAQLKPEQAAAIPYLCSFLNVLSKVKAGPEDRILITGQSVIRHLSEQFVRALLPQAPTTQVDLAPTYELPAELDGQFDVLIHGVSDPEDLQLSLSAVREDGEAFLLVAPGSHVLALDFYPNIHRSCLRTHVRRVGSRCRPASCPNPGHSLLYRLLGEGRIDIEPLLSHVSKPSELADLQVQGSGPSDKLIAVTWP